MGLAESALVLLGIGIVSSRFKAGVGLGELGTGIQTLVAAPLTGTGAGLSVFAGGLRDVFETFGDLGRGLGALFENIPQLPPQQEGRRLPRTDPSADDPFSGGIRPPGVPTQGLITVSGGDTTTNLPGGGGSVPPARLQELLKLRGQFPRGSDEAQYWNTLINQLTQPGGYNV